MPTMLAMSKETEPNTVPVTIRMNREIRARLIAFGAKSPYNPSLTQLIDAAVREYLDKHDAKADASGDAPPRRPSRPK